MIHFSTQLQKFWYLVFKIDGWLLYDCSFICLNQHLDIKGFFSHAWHQFGGLLNSKSWNCLCMTEVAVSALVGDEDDQILCYAVNICGGTGGKILFKTANTPSNRKWIYSAICEGSILPNHGHFCFPVFHYPLFMVAQFFLLDNVFKHLGR